MQDIVKFLGIGMFKMFSPWFSANNKLIITITTRCLLQLSDPWQCQMQSLPRIANQDQRWESNPCPADALPTQRCTPVLIAFCKWDSETLIMTLDSAIEQNTTFLNTMEVLLKICGNPSKFDGNTCPPSMIDGCTGFTHHCSLG